MLQILRLYQKKQQQKITVSIYDCVSCNYESSILRKLAENLMGLPK